LEVLPIIILKMPIIGIDNIDDDNDWMNYTDDDSVTSLFQLIKLQLNSLFPGPEKSKKINPIIVPKEYEIINGMTGMNSSIITTIMKFNGFDDSLNRSVSFHFFFDIMSFEKIIGVSQDHYKWTKKINFIWSRRNGCILFSYLSFNLL
jgi:hypothetical protein